MDRPITDLIAALVADHAIDLDHRGLPALPNDGWAGKYMNVGFNLSGDYNTFQLERSFSAFLEEEDEKDLRIIAQKVGYEVEVEATTILFRLYSAWKV